MKTSLSLFKQHVQNIAPELLITDLLVLDATTQEEDPVMDCGPMSGVLRYLLYINSDLKECLNSIVDYDNPNSYPNYITEYYGYDENIRGYHRFACELWSLIKQCEYDYILNLLFEEYRDILLVERDSNCIPENSTLFENRYCECGAASWMYKLSEQLKFHNCPITPLYN